MAALNGRSGTVTVSALGSTEGSFVTNLGPWPSRSLPPRCEITFNHLPSVFSFLSFLFFSPLSFTVSFVSCTARLYFFLIYHLYSFPTPNPPFCLHLFILSHRTASSPLSLPGYCTSSSFPPYSSSFPSPSRGFTLSTLSCALFFPTDWSFSVEAKLLWKHK